MDTRTLEIQIPPELLDRVFPRERLHRRDDDAAPSHVDRAVDRAFTAMCRLDCGETMELTAIEED